MQTLAVMTTSVSELGRDEIALYSLTAVQPNG